MSTTQSTLPADSSSHSVERDRERAVEHSRGRSLERNVELEPTPRSWMVVAAGGLVPLGLAIAAAVTTNMGASERVAMTAWISVAVVGTASVISAAVASRRRSSSTDRDHQGTRNVDRVNAVSRNKMD